jgi:hypothetical protein
MAFRSDQQRRGKNGIAGGAVAGIVGGVFIAVFLLLTNLAAGRGFWTTFKGAGAPFFGERAMEPGFDALAVLVGLVSHFAVSIGWGVLFGLLVYGLSKRATVLLGAVWGLVVWVGMYYVLLPVIGLGEIATSTPIAMAIISHLLFGLGVGLGFLPYQRRRAASRATRDVPLAP